jgi:L-lactate dehydrogenase (cytochrome)
MARNISALEIAKHCAPDDIWIVVDDTVYDMTEFAPEHPGGASSMHFSTAYSLRLTDNNP